MRITDLTFIGFYLNGALGSGKYNDITIEEVKKHLRDRSIFDFLENRLLDIDLSAIKKQDRRKLNDEWLDLAEAVNESRKMGVKENGICLLVAYLFEGIQRRCGSIEA